jgi:hypothetical protein
VTIIEMLLSTHVVLVKFFIVALLLIMLVPNMLKSDLTRVVFWSRIGYFLFWAAWTMVVFSGLLIFAVKHGELSLSVAVMIVAAIVLGALDGYRAVKMKKFWLKDENGLKFSNMLVALELLIVVAVTVLAIRVH